MKGTSRAAARRKAAKRQRKKRGLAPGAPVYAGEEHDWSVGAHLFEYDADGCVEARLDPNRLRGPGSADKMLWVDVTGIHDERLVTELGGRFGVHALAIEDVLNPSTRPKYEAHDGARFVVARMLRLDPDAEPEQPRVVSEQIAMIFAPGWLLSFQEEPGDLFDPVRARLRTGGGRLRGMGSDFLLHGLLDALVDGYFEVVDALEDATDALSQRALTADPEELVAAAQILRGELTVQRRAATSLRDGVSRLLVDADEAMHQRTAPYFRDLHDHLIQVLELTDSAMERSQSAIELSLVAASNRMNDTMRILTVVSAIFIPLTFIVGVYGMNFHHMPELDWPWAYPALMISMLVGSVGLAAYFRSRDWL